MDGAKEAAEEQKRRGPGGGGQSSKGCADTRTDPSWPRGLREVRGTWAGCLGASSSHPGGHRAAATGGHRGRWVGEEVGGHSQSWESLPSCSVDGKRQDKRETGTKVSGPLRGEEGERAQMLRAPRGGGRRQLLPRQLHGLGDGDDGTSEKESITDWKWEAGRGPGGSPMASVLALGNAGSTTGRGLAKSVVLMGPSAGCMVTCGVLQRSRCRDVGTPLFFTRGT